MLIMDKASAIDWLKYELEFNYGDHDQLYIDWKAFDIAIAEAKDMEQNRMLDLIMFIRKNNNESKSAYDLYQDFVNGVELSDEGPEYDGAGFTENDR